jgi:hypothetical protein
MTWPAGLIARSGEGCASKIPGRYAHAILPSSTGWQFLLEECTVGNRATKKDPSATGHTVPTRNSFIVRISREGDSGGWQGWVQHTRSGKSSAVQTLEALWAFIEQQTGILPLASRKGLK